MNSVQEAAAQRTEAAKKITLLVYILQAIGVLVCFTAIAGIIINHLKKNEIKGTWLESHFRWQMRTFWFALLWYCLGILLIFAGFGAFILIGAGLWLIYRIVRGWLTFNDRVEMYDA